MIRSLSPFLALIHLIAWVGRASTPAFPTILSLPYVQAHFVRELWKLSINLRWYVLLPMRHASQEFHYQLYANRI